MYLVIVTHARQRESTLFKYLHTFSYGIAVMWDTCKGWWEGKIKVEVDEVLLLQRCRGERCRAARAATRRPTSHQQPAFAAALPASTGFYEEKTHTYS